MHMEEWPRPELDRNEQPQQQPLDPRDFPQPELQIVPVSQETPEKDRSKMPSNIVGIEDLDPFLDEQQRKDRDRDKQPPTYH